MATPEVQSLTGGELNAEISRAVVRIYSQYVGRGPTKAQTVFHGPIVVTLGENGLTKAERSLVDDDKLEAVLGMRQALQRTMRDDLVGEVERLTGRQVTAFMSDNHFNPDLAAELFVLDGAEPAG